MYWYMIGYISTKKLTDYVRRLIAFIVSLYLFNIIISAICYDVNTWISSKIHDKAVIIAEEMYANRSHAEIERLGHKYADMILSQPIMFPNRDEAVRGFSEPSLNKNYIEKNMVLETTAYWTHDPVDASGTGIAYDGTEAVAFQTCAIDPKIIPLGSEVYIPTIGWLRCNDTGNAIKGHILDIAMPSREDAWNWGRRYVYAKVRIRNTK